MKDEIIFTGVWLFCLLFIDILNRLSFFRFISDLQKQFYTVGYLAKRCILKVKNGSFIQDTCFSHEIIVFAYLKYVLKQTYRGTRHFNFETKNEKIKINVQAFKMKKRFLYKIVI